MFDSPHLADLRALTVALSRLETPAPDAERIDRIRAMEDLKNALCAAQARETAALDTSIRTQREQVGVRADKQGAGIAGQVGLARRLSPHQAAVKLGLATVLTVEMPCTLAAMTSGVLSEWRATLLVRETACLTVEDRQTIDRAIAGDRDRLEQMGDRELIGEIQRLAASLDAASVVRRRARAEAERTVTIRPAPDTMSYLTGLLPVTQGVAIFAALSKAADSARSAGDLRSRGQVMADTLVERVTGRPATEPVPVSIDLVMTDRSLLAGDSEPAELIGYGIVPAEWARALVSAATDSRLAWLRRVYTAPTTGDLIAMDSRAQRFPAGLHHWLRVRDRSCRTPWCDAPIRHDDHVVRRADAGPTSAANGQGLCEACNYAKDAVGWRARPRSGIRHTVRITTPTGHTYDSTAPPLPGTSHRTTTRLELYFARLVLAA
ncbi:DUF222 domain-containing protein [Nocardioides sp.]|uniref:HNH endonuclease n=1 Tax=Nocardioides sp. TaxID=35761 RepID=UPI00356A08F5